MALARKSLATLGELLHAHAGLELPAWIVESRVEARMQKLDLEEAAYVSLLASPRGDRELHALVEAVRVGETRFFRHQPQVDALLEVVVPAWRVRGVSAPRVWSAGCASGEEPYTLALVLARALPAPQHAPSVHATDVSHDAVASARRGAFSADALDQIPEAYRFGVRCDGRALAIRPEIAGMVTFEQQNLADAFPARSYHLIWCRNVLIYFGPEAKQRVLGRLVDALEPGGYLFVGYSETLRDVPGLVPVRYEEQVLWQKAQPATRSANEARPSLGSSPEVSKVDGLVARPKPKAPEKRATHTKPVGARDEDALARSRTPDSPTVTLHIGGVSAASVERRLANALARPGVSKVTVELDSADFVDDEVAPILHRALASAKAARVGVELRATRPGAQRWLRRHRLPGGDP